MRLMTRQQPADTPEADRDWFGGRRWTGIAALGVIVVVAVCAIIVVIGTRSHGGGGQPVAAPPDSAAPSPAVTATPPTSGLVDAPVPSAPPPGVTWSLYEFVAVPRSAAAGPAHVDGAIAIGYAHTPDGALLAAANEMYRFQFAPDDQWRAAAAAMIAPGPGRDAWVKTRAAHPYGDSTGTAADFAQIAGFQFVSYTPADAVVQLVTRTTEGDLQVGTFHVTWVDGDWRLVLLPPNGSPTANVQAAPSLVGFVMWGGV